MEKGRSQGTMACLVLGVLLLLWTALIIAVGISYQLGGLSSNTPQENASAATMMLLACTPANVVLTAIFLGLYFIRKKKEDKLEDLASYLKLYRRTPLVKVAQRLGMTEHNAERLLLKCIELGLVRGFFDRKTEEFILEESIASMREGVKCPNCGASSDTVALSGEILKCAYCGSVIPSTRPTPSPQSSMPLPPPPPPPPPPDDQRFCTYCGSPSRFIEEYQRWYCDKCSNYQP